MENMVPFPCHCKALCHMFKASDSEGIFAAILIKRARELIYDKYKGPLKI